MSNAQMPDLTAEPTDTIVEWLVQEVNQRNDEPNAYGKHNEYSKSDYSKSFGQYAKS